MNKRLMMLLALLLVFAVASAGMTMAWFTDDIAEEASFIAGTVKLSSFNPYADFEGIIDDNWNPGDCDCFRFIVCNDGSKDIVVRAKIEKVWQYYHEAAQEWYNWNPGNPSVALSEAAIFDCPPWGADRDAWLSDAIEMPDQICCFTVRSTGRGMILYYVNCLNQLCRMDNGEVVGSFDPETEVFTVFDGTSSGVDMVIDATTTLNGDGEVFVPIFDCYVSFNIECWEPEGEYYYYMGGHNIFVPFITIDPVLYGDYDELNFGEKECVGLCLPVYFNHTVDNDYQGKKLKLEGIVEAVQATNDAPQYEWGTHIFDFILPGDLD